MCCIILLVLCWLEIIIVSNNVDLLCVCVSRYVKVVDKDVTNC